MAQLHLPLKYGLLKAVMAVREQGTDLDDAESKRVLADCRTGLNISYAHHRPVPRHDELLLGLPCLWRRCPERG